MGYSGAGAWGAVGDLANSLGGAFMRIGNRQLDDERIAAENAHIQGRERIADQRYNQERMHDLRAEGYDVQPNQATALGRAIGGADRATGSPGSGYTVGALDVTKSQAFQSAKALRDMENNSSLEATEYALRNLHQGPTRQADVSLPANVREQSRNEARSTALGILQKLGDTPEAREEINKIPGIYGGYVSSAYHDAVADKALADQTRDNDEPNFQRFTGPDGVEYAFNPRDASATPVGGVGTKAQAVPGGAPDLNAEQGKSVQFYQRGAPALAKLEQLFQSQGAPGGMARTLGAVPFVGNRLQGQHAQLYDATVNELVTALLRKDSGATITDSEMEIAWDTYIPRAGESPEVAQQKLSAARRALESLRSTAGPGAGLMGGGQGSAPRQYSPENPFASR